MQAVVSTEAGGTTGTLGYSSHSLEGRFWRFFRVSLCFDVGFGLYFFLINLYLSRLGFGESTIGIVAGTLTVGNVAATIPVGIAARRFGLQNVLLFCFVTAPLVGAIRVLAFQPAVQIALAFLQGAMMSGYTVCFAPALASVTTQQNRTRAFSLTFGAGIGSGVIGGLVGGAAPEWLQHIIPSMRMPTAMGWVLLLGCIIALAGFLPLIRLELPVHDAGSPTRNGGRATPFLIRFLLMIAVWNFSITGFAPFATIYLSGPLHVPLSRIGMIFSMSQLLQVGGILAAPGIYRRTGKEAGIALLQGLAALALVTLWSVHGLARAVAAYLCLTMFQYMCNPAIYSLLMDRTKEQARPAASALQNFVSCSSAAAASALAGFLISKAGYPLLFVACALLSIVAAMLMVSIPRPTEPNVLSPKHSEPYV